MVPTQKTQSQDHSVRFIEVVGLILLFSLALGLRIYDSSAASFSIDEGSSLLFAGTPEWRALFWDNNPFLYHLLLKGWLHVFPMTEFYTRLLSALISSVGVIAMYRVGQVTGSKSRAWFLGILSAFSVYSIRYGQEVRMYALFELATVVHLICLLQLSKAATLKARIDFGLANVLLLFTHLLGAVPVLFGFGYLWEQRKWFRSRYFAYLFVGMVALISVTLFFDFDMRYLVWQKVVRQYLGAPYTPWDVLLEIGQSDSGVALFVAVVSALACFHPDLKMRSMSRKIFVALAILVWCGLMVTHANHRDVFLPRYFIFLNPYALLLFALGCEALVAKVSKPWFAVAAQAVILSGFSIFVFHAYDSLKPPWKKAAGVAIDKKVELALTTRPYGLSVPYYRDAGIEVKEFTFSETFIKQIQTDLQKHAVIAVVDNYLSKRIYLVPLLKDLDQAKIGYESVELSEGYGEPIFILIIYRPPA
jgi:uncharacterized membrane protein